MCMYSCTVGFSGFLHNSNNNIGDSNDKNFELKMYALAKVKQKSKPYELLKYWYKILIYKSQKEYCSIVLSAKQLNFIRLLMCHANLRQLAAAVDRNNTPPTPGPSSLPPPLPRLSFCIDSAVNARNLLLLWMLKMRALNEIKSAAFCVFPPLLHIKLFVGWNLHTSTHRHTHTRSMNASTQIRTYTDPDAIASQHFYAALSSNTFTSSVVTLAIFGRNLVKKIKQ